MDKRSYKPFAIPAPARLKDSPSAPKSPEPPALSLAPAFAEVDCGGGEGTDPAAAKGQKILPPPKDEIRERFYEMRRIARNSALPPHGYSKLYDRQNRREIGKVFVKQGQFMEDFTDSYPEPVPFSAYYTCYQMMNYDQLRTYFTWRTKVREGGIAETSLSYAFLYIYELINLIGAENPAEALEKLRVFWQTYRTYEPAVDKYMRNWFRDYHIYYDLSHSLMDFAKANGIDGWYPQLADKDQNFDLYCSVSRYDIRKSAFMNDENSEMIRACFYHILQRLREVFANAGTSFEDNVFWPYKHMSPWAPFGDALFARRGTQPDKRVVLSQNEIYICSRGDWTFSSTISMESGRQLVGYVFRQMESTLRALAGYKHKLSASLGMIDSDVLDRLRHLQIPLDGLVTDAATAYYKEATKTVVTVDYGALERIRREAERTQEQLTVPESVLPDAAVAFDAALPEPPLPAAEKTVKANAPPPSAPDEWADFAAALTDTERRAVAALLEGRISLAEFAAANGLLPELLAESINTKAADTIGDNLLDEELCVYEDYAEQAAGMVHTHD